MTISQRLFTIACWHQDKSEIARRNFDSAPTQELKAGFDRDRKRHEEIADRLFIRSWQAR